MAKRGGRRDGAGRKKGVPNKFNSDIKAMIIGALNERGGQEWLVGQMTKNPVAFIGLIGKVLPTTLAGDPTAPLSIAILSGVPRALEDEQPELQANGNASH